MKKINRPEFHFLCLVRVDSFGAPKVFVIQLVIE